jgi:hypothetical protein
MANITISEALAALKGANPEEIREELSIIQEEIDELEKQIVAKRGLMRQVRKLAGLPAGKRTAATVPQPATHAGSNGSGPKLWQQIQTYLEHAGPSSASLVATAMEKSAGAVYTELKKRQGSVFEQLRDKRWRLKMVSAKE